MNTKKKSMNFDLGWMIFNSGSSVELEWDIRGGVGFF